MIWQVVRFSIVGVANTVIGLSIIFGAKFFVDAGDIAANVAGYAVALTVSFLLNRSWTFRHQGDIAVAAARFLGAFFIAYGVNLAIVLILIHWFGVNSYLAQVLGLLPFTITFFLISKKFVF